MKALSSLMLVLALAPSAYAANDVNGALEMVLRQTASTLAANGLAPAVLADTTVPGAERFAKEFLFKHNGDVIAEELAKSYVDANGSSTSLRGLVPERAPIGDFLTDSQVDWTKVDATKPNVKSVVVLSAPAFDQFGNLAVVRVDIIARDHPRHSITSIFELRRQSDGSWHPLAAQGSYESLHR